MPTKTVENVLRPKIIKMDAESCKRIISKINTDYDYEQLEQQYHLESRQQTRKKLEMQQGIRDYLQKRAGQNVFRGKSAFSHFRGGMKTGEPAKKRAFVSLFGGEKQDLREKKDRKRLNTMGSQRLEILA